MSTTDTLLSVEDLHVHYGKSHVLHGVDLRVGRNEVISLLGRNGSGRSTTMKAIMGLVPPSAGSIRLRERELAGARPYAVCRAGIGYVPEEREVFANLTVDENLRMGEQRAVPGAHRWTVEQMFDYFPRLKERRNTKAGSMSGGEQQMLAIARALSTHPRLLILDEATEGLAPVIREEIWHCIATLKSEGEAILVVDKYVQRLLPLADRHVILERGRVVWQGDSAALDADRSLWTRYLGV
jgi:branched-chain amino acid transport system ATP-binding protein